MTVSDTTKVAAIQHAPVFLDRERSIEKACDLIAEVGKQKTRLAVFPEAFIPGYPCWVWKVAAGETKIIEALHAELLMNSVDVPSDATAKLRRAAKQAKTFVVIGINERNTEASGETLYNSLLYISDEGEIMGCHRKLIPTGGERIVWGRGDGSTLDVYDLSIGRLGGLICWENYMPLARYTMFAAGTQIYVAPTWDSSESWLATLRHIAVEGRCYVIGCCSAVNKGDIPERFEFRERFGEWINAGRSAIVDPRGKFIAGPVEKQEEILYADIDLTEVHRLRWELDAAGHYARPDVFRLTVNRNPQSIIESSTEYE